MEGRARRAQLDLDAARAVFAPLGARLDVGRIDLARRSVQLPTRLSEREAEVLRLVPAGRTNREIAGVLFISKFVIEREIPGIGMSPEEKGGAAQKSSDAVSALSPPSAVAGKASSRLTRSSVSSSRKTMTP